MYAEQGVTVAQYPQVTAYTKSVSLTVRLLVRRSGVAKAECLERLTVPHGIMGLASS